MDSSSNSIPDYLAVGLQAVLGWLKQSHLRLNPSKTEILWLGRVTSCLGCQLLAGPLLAGPLTLALIVKSLGVLLDASLSMEVHITNTVRLALFSYARLGNWLTSCLILI